MSLSTNSISPTNFTLIFISFALGLDLTKGVKSQAFNITTQIIHNNYVRKIFLAIGFTLLNHSQVWAIENEK